MGNKLNTITLAALATVGSFISSCIKGSDESAKIEAFDNVKSVIKLDPRIKDSTEVNPDKPLFSNSIKTNVALDPRAVPKNAVTPTKIDTATTPVKENCK